MLDKSIPFTGLLMEKTDPERYPVYQLPDGYTFDTYHPGDELAWGQIHYDLGQTASLDEAVELFRKEFLYLPQQAARRCFFVKDAGGQIAATASLWTGDTFGSTLQRIHWVATAPDHQGHGLAKALLTRLFQLYHELGYSRYIYLISQTWSYKALHLYMRFGFKPYMGKKPVNWKSDNFDEENSKAWELVLEKMKLHDNLS